MKSEWEVGHIELSYSGRQRTFPPVAAGGKVGAGGRTTGIKLASPQLMFATLAFGLGVNLHELWAVQVFSSLGT